MAGEVFHTTKGWGDVLIATVPKKIGSSPLEEIVALFEKKELTVINCTRVNYKNAEIGYYNFSDKGLYVSCQVEREDGRRAHASYDAVWARVA